MIKYFLPLALACTACARKEPVVHMPREEALRISKEAAQDSFARLSQELANAIADGGPVAAIPVCSTKAQDIVNQVAGERSLALVRLSDRPRNPAQKAAGADLKAMDVFRETLKTGAQPTPQVEKSADGSSVVRLPILLSQPLCLQCHGSESDIAPATRKAILATYPDDKATGYRLNDLRGIWRVTVSPP